MHMLTCASNKRTLRVFSGGKIFNFPGYFVPPLVSVNNIALFVHNIRAFDKILLSRKSIVLRLCEYTCKHSKGILTRAPSYLMF